LYQIGLRNEQLGKLDNALSAYRYSDYPGARMRSIRVLEKAEQITQAMELATIASCAPESPSETQHLSRILPRLRRKLGLPRQAAPPRPDVQRIDLHLPRPAEWVSVEESARRHFTDSHSGTEVHYVENALINSLFGLLCWDAIFHALPGAFFHPFQAGPADLHHADFFSLRAGQFQASLSQLDSQQYKHTIRHHFVLKSGIQSPFVFWEALTESLLEQALACLPAAHLTKWFERILQDIPAHRSGYPDLIQFWPQQQRYRMIEIKGPGDRLQDNQIRFIEYCIAHDMLVAVCHVEWQENI
jgi:hypothetical protein